MFESISQKLESALARLRSKGRLTEADVDEALADVRIALLDGDVNVRVARSLVDRVRERAVGAALDKSLDPGHQVVKIVYEELVDTLGREPVRLKLASIPPTIVFLAGLQGSGKTTTAGKLATWFRREGKRPILVACDLQRPAAVDQLRKVGEAAGVPVYWEEPPADPVEVGRRALEYVGTTDRDVMIVDTAGRLAVDEELMAELARLKQALSPHAVLLVVDAMTGQDAVGVAQEFVDKVGVDGVILSKLDGDARGGAAISVRAVTGAPIYFAGVGERLEDLEVFYPDRMASRILGMGDILTVIEKASGAIDKGSARTLQEKIAEGKYDLEDFLAQMRQLRSAGPLGKLLSLLPGIPGIGKIQESDVDEKELSRIEAIILSMTPEERANPKIIDGSRRKRIARGAGVRPSDVNALLEQFFVVQKMVKQISGVSLPKRLRKFASGIDLGALSNAGAGLGLGTSTPPSSSRALPRTPAFKGIPGATKKGPAKKKKKRRK